MQETEPTPEFSFECPNCGTNLLTPGAVIVWTELPERMIGHIEESEEGKVNVIIDDRDEVFDPELHCRECGEILNKFKIDEMYLDSYLDS